MHHLGKYQILSKIGDGGMGSVYRACLRPSLSSDTVRCETAIKQVALKVIHPHLNQERDFVLMFLDEVRIAMAMNHPNIVQTFDAGVSSEHYYMVMEFINGCSLRQLLDALNREAIQLPLEIALFIGIEVCSALAYAHQCHERLEENQGIIHRDISPGNILISRQGEVKLADFGVAKAADRFTQTTAHLIKGKLIYMAPEQANGQAEPRSDLFSLGAVLYETLAGRPLRTEKRLSEICQGVGWSVAPSQIRKDIPANLEEIMARCLAADPEFRPDSAVALRRALSSELFHLQDQQGQRQDGHETLRLFLSTHDKMLNLKTEGIASQDSRVKRLARAVLKEVLEVSTDHGADEADSETSAPLTKQTHLGRLETTVIETPSNQPLPSASSQLTVPRFKMTQWIVLVALISSAAIAWGLWRSINLESRSGAMNTSEHERHLVDGSLIKKPQPADRSAGQKSVSSQSSAKKGNPPSAGSAEKRNPPSAGPANRKPSSASSHSPKKSQISESSAYEELTDSRGFLDQESNIHKTLSPTKRPSKEMSKGFLDINSVPWAKIYIDSRFYGETPLQRISLKPGTHRIRLTNPLSKLTRQFKVSIQSGKQLKKVFYLQPQKSGSN